MTARPTDLVYEGTGKRASWDGIRRFVIDRAEGWCEICRDALATEVDHIWPRALGGTDHSNNLQAACGPCNRVKGDRVEWSSSTTQQHVQAMLALTRRTIAVADAWGPLVDAVGETGLERLDERDALELADLLDAASRRFQLWRDVSLTWAAFLDEVAA